MRRFAIVALWVCLAGPASAQLPNVQLPNLPDVRGAPGIVDDTLREARDLTDLRRLRVGELLRRNRAELERDSDGEPIVRSQVLAWSPSPEALDQARAAGFEIVRESELEGLDARMVVLRAPARMSTRRALRQLRDLDPQGTYDFNHVYLESGPAPGGGAKQEAGAGGGRVGLIDGGLDTNHPSLRGARIHQRGFAGDPTPSAHGEATASLLIGRADGFAGAAPGAELYAADVYCGAPTGGSADAVVRALAWMAQEHVAVVNVSLVGARNDTLEAAVRAMLRRGHVIVAAVGNDGPAARPLYPAAFSGVIGVTGVDARQRVLTEAGRGAQVDFAAPGSDMSAAAPDGRFAVVRGTSFAAPIVAGLLARDLEYPDTAAAERAMVQLAARAVDLGARGRDDIYGAGLVGADLRAEPALAHR